eukprot:jgi/Ulvmu1/2642/UM014_0094.1
MSRSAACMLLRLSARTIHGLSEIEAGSAGKSWLSCMSTHQIPGSRSACPASMHTRFPEQQCRAYGKVIKRPAPRGRPLNRGEPVIQAVQVSESWQTAFQLPDVVLNRRIELGDLMLGFEQERQMSLQTPSGEILLAIAEEPGGLFSGVLLRQLFESTRAFTINVFALDNPSQPHVLFQIKRSFPWFNPMAWLFREILVTDAQNRIVASVTRAWHPLYRSYDLYQAEDADSDGDTVLKMFGRVNVPFWTAMFTWAYPVHGAHGEMPASIERIFGAGVQGAAEQIFTEKGNYHLAFRDPAMRMNQRLATLACAISIDYDYYSRRVGGGGWIWPAMIVWTE